MLGISRFWWCCSSGYIRVSTARATHHLEEGRGAEELDCGVRQLPAAAKLRRRQRLVQGVELSERVHQPPHVVLGATVSAGNACGRTAVCISGTHILRTRRTNVYLVACCVGSGETRQRSARFAMLVVQDRVLTTTTNCHVWTISFVILRCSVRTTL